VASQHPDKACPDLLADVGFLAATDHMEFFNVVEPAHSEHKEPPLE
jgi:hypothetical protein